MGISTVCLTFEIIFSKNFSITFQKVVMFVVTINQALKVQNKQVNKRLPFF